MKRYELTKEQWERIQPLLPPEKTGKRGHPCKDNRTMLNGMLWIARSGAQWRELPEVWSLAVHICPIRQMAKRWHIGNYISYIDSGCRHGEFEHGFHLCKGT